MRYPVCSVAVRPASHPRGQLEQSAVSRTPSANSVRGAPKVVHSHSHSQRFADGRAAPRPDGHFVGDSDRRHVAVSSFFVYSRRGQCFKDKTRPLACGEDVSHAEPATATRAAFVRQEPTEETHTCSVPCESYSNLRSLGRRGGKGCLWVTMLPSMCCVTSQPR